MYPIYSAFVQAVYPEQDYDIQKSQVMCSGTTYAYKNLITGVVDIIFVAGPSNDQMKDAELNGVELKFTPLGREAFVFFVNKDNPVDSLTVEQIQDIYSGRITNWQDVGGSNTSIRAFQRPEGSGSQTMLQRVMAGKELMQPHTQDVQSGMGGIIQKTADYRNHSNAIGYSFLFFATEMVQNGDIRLLSIKGMYPNHESIRSGQYPLAAEFYAVTDANNENPNVAKFLDWIVSSQGQRLVKETGYTPVQDIP